MEMYLNTRSIADELGVRLDTVSWWIRRGRLKAVRTSPRGPYRVSKREFERFRRWTEPRE